MHTSYTGWAQPHGSAYVWGDTGGIALRSLIQPTGSKQGHSVRFASSDVSVVADQLTLSSSRARARMFCYGIFTHPLSSAYERPAYRISLCVLACVGCGTRGRLLGLSGRMCHSRCPSLYSPGQDDQLSTLNTHEPLSNRSRRLPSKLGSVVPTP